MNSQNMKIIIVIIIFSSIVLWLIMIKRMSKKYAIKRNMAKKNEIIINNKDKYEQIMNENESNLFHEKRIAAYYTIVYIVITVILILNVRTMLMWVLSALFLVVFGLIGNRIVGPYLTKHSQNYNDIVSKVLKELDDNIEYFPNDGFKYEEYRNLFFAEPCDYFSSNDMIINPQNNFCYSDILIENTETDTEGHSYSVVKFRGSLSKIKINNVGCTIILGGLGKKSFLNSQRFKNIEFENEEFNKLFICFSDNELMAYKLLTPDVMEKFVSIKNATLSDIDIRIINDKLYIRFEGINLFTGNLLSNEAEKKELFVSITVLDQIMKTIINLKNIIDDKVK